MKQRPLTAQSKAPDGRIGAQLPQKHALRLGHEDVTARRTWKVISPVHGSQHRPGTQLLDITAVNAMHESRSRVDDGSTHRHLADPFRHRDVLRRYRTGPPSAQRHFRTVRDRTICQAVLLIRMEDEPGRVLG
ncbi:hypothetical protein L249_7293 [Ophiocordyceps polyrhachis-furcata BCC 54312]|uniref:Uncharacterized protein n=1 Tax=Ophiocordyceps polyrhachis-furcata BCC 54312 TaxID=1330021 RepID=A0A367LAP6_9HYPO|nr:hypothetical protein L249_7293 [Ophiocordyceps polyrhachis-furcata BCC 54312]